MTNANRCPVHHRPLVFGTDLLGRLVSSCQACERRRRHQCIDCGRPVQGKAWRCREDIRLAKAKTLRRYDRDHRDERRARERARMAQETPEHRAHRLGKKREWREQHPLRVKLAKRNGRLDGTWGYPTRERYLAAQRKANAKRAETKRAHARQRYYALHPDRPAPQCTGCRADLPFRGTGRPKKWCDTCRPFQSWQDRKAARARKESKAA